VNQVRTGVFEPGPCKWTGRGDTQRLANHSRAPKKPRPEFVSAGGQGGTVYLADAELRTICFFSHDSSEKFTFFFFFRRFFGRPVGRDNNQSFNVRTSLAEKLGIQGPGPPPQKKRLTRREGAVIAGTLPFSPPLFGTSFPFLVFFLPPGCFYI